MAYPEIVQSGAVERFVGLLSHENVDIVIDIVEIVHELTDEDVGRAISLGLGAIGINIEN